MNGKTLFVDTGAWFALMDGSDQFHDKAAELYPSLFRRYGYLTTTNLVISETYTLAMRALGHRPAIAFLANIGASPRVFRVFSDRVLEDMAEDILTRYEDQDFSYTDAVSFAVMKHYGIEQAFSFDRHFITAGFALLPE